MYGGPPPPGHYRPPPNGGYPPPFPPPPGGYQQQPGGFQPPPGGMPMPNFPPPGMPAPTLTPPGPGGMNGNYPPYPPPPGMHHQFPPPQGFAGSPQGFAGSPMPPPTLQAGSPSGPPPGMFYQAPPPPQRGAPGLGYGGGAGGPLPIGGGLPGGSPASAPGLPTRPSGHGPGPGGMQRDNGFVKQVKTTAVFVGGIPNGITDPILQGLLQTCGPVHKINRVKGPSGKPQAFGFAEFEDPEVVLRCLKCVNGVELPDISPEGRRQGIKKTLTVKADEKTRSFLAEYEKSSMRMESDDQVDASARERVSNIVKALNDPSADLVAIIGQSAAPDVENPKNLADPYEVPEHLRDLDEQELPENQRAVVMDSIAMFRDRNALRETEKRKQEEQREAARMAQLQQSRSAAPAAPAGPSQGSAAQSFAASQPGGMRQWGSRQEPEREVAARPIGDGPQAYNKPVGFAKAQTLEVKGEGERTDEEEEELRLQARRKRLDQELRERERRVETRERQVSDRLAREAKILRDEGDILEKDRDSMRKMLAAWDDDLKISSGREYFYADRGRWRSHRQAIRRKEYQEDVRDRQQEADEQVQIDKESEDFLEKQMQEMASLEAKQRAAGFLFNDGAPIKVAPEKATIKIEAPLPVNSGKAKTTVAFGAEDEEEEDRQKRRRLIKLDEDEDLSDAERAARRAAKLNDLKKTVPEGKDGLWAYKVKWDAITEHKIQPLVRQKMVDALGELDDDELVNFVLQHVRDKSRPEVIVEGLEPVFDEDAESFVIAVWRQLAFESAAFVAGLETGDALVSSSSASS